MRNTSLCSRCWSKGVGDRKEGKQGGGSGREGELLHFSPLLPPPPFLCLPHRPYTIIMRVVIITGNINFHKSFQIFPKLSINFNFHKNHQSINKPWLVSINSGEFLCLYVILWGNQWQHCEMPAVFSG